MIIVEGCDGGGKSRLVHRLASDLGYRVHQFGPPKKPALEEYLYWLLDQPDSQVVLDRYHLGELVYGPLLRGKSSLDLQTRYVIEMTASIRGATLVHVTAENEIIERTLRKRGDELIQPEQVSRIQSAFTEVCRTSILPRNKYHWSWASAQISYENIIHLEEVEMKNAAKYRDHLPHLPGIGELVRPTIAFVGERPNPKRVGASRGVPFAVGPAGEWLFQALDDLRIMGRSYITNAARADGSTTSVGEELRFLRPNQVVALGQLASKILTRQGIEHVTVYHPQYARRFRSSLDYSQMILNAIHPPVLA